MLLHKYLTNKIWVWLMLDFFSKILFRMYLIEKKITQRKSLIIMAVSSECQFVNNNFYYNICI